MDCEELLTKEELRQRLHLRSTRGVDHMVKCGKIPVVDIGHRTKRFLWSAVLAALDKLTVRAIE